MDEKDYLTEAEEALQMLGKGYNNDPIPETQFSGTMSGYTPAPDALVQLYGYVTALVWGRMWRYCQMSDGVCRAKLGKIAYGLGMSERTIIRHIETLCSGGYLFDMTPALRNKPHIYADTGKIKIKFNVEAGVTESHPAMTESHPAMTESHPEGDRESVEDSIKKANKDISTTSKKRKSVNAMWDLQHGETPDVEQAQSEQSEIDKIRNISDRLEIGLRRGQFPQSTAAQNVYKWISKQEAAGESLDRFITWAMDGRRAEFSFIYHKDPTTIKRDWYQVFPPENVRPTAKPEADGGYR